MPTPPDITLAHCLRVYTKEILPTKAPRTQQQHSRAYAVILAYFGPLRLRDLTPARLRSWRDTLSGTLAPGTVRRYLATLSGPLTMAVREYGWLAENPLHLVRKPLAPPGRVRCLSDAERLRLLDACQQSVQPALYPLVVLALSTGARRGELSRLRWRDVEFQQGCVRFMQTKNGQPRVVPLGAVALAVLQAWCPAHAEHGAWVFPGTGCLPLHWAEAWRTARRRAALQDFRFHDLRHTAASYLAMSGASLREIAEVLGHKSIAQTYRYTHLTLPHTRGVVERMSQQFLGEGGGSA